MERATDTRSDPADRTNASGTLATVFQDGTAYHVMPAGACGGARRRHKGFLRSAWRGFDSFAARTAAPIAPGPRRSPPSRSRGGPSWPRPNRNGCSRCTASPSCRPGSPPRRSSRRPRGRVRLPRGSEALFPDDHAQNRRQLNTPIAKGWPSLSRAGGSWGLRPGVQAPTLWGWLMGPRSDLLSSTRVVTGAFHFCGRD
jgi:hypothetical protein